MLRPLSHADAASIQTAASVHAVADTMISIPHPYPNGEAERYVSRQIAEFEQNQPQRGGQKLWQKKWLPYTLEVVYAKLEAVATDLVAWKNISSNTAFEGAAATAIGG